MKKTYKLQLVLLLFSITLVSCNNSQRSCSSDISKSLLKQIFAKNSDLDIYRNSKIDISHLELLDFYNQYSVLQHIRTSSIQDDIKKCECQATLKFPLPSDILNKLKSGKTEEFEIVYSVQETEEEEIYVEVLFPVGLENIVATYLKLIKEYK